MEPKDIEFFRANGYVSLGKLFDGADLRRIVGVYDNDRSRFADHWYGFGGSQTLNCDGLLTSPELDEAVRHPRVMETVAELMGDAICFSEMCIRHMGPYDGELSRGWHRDRGHWPEHPLRLDYAQLMLYLTDVDETTHCFSLSPESADDEVLDMEAQLARGGIHDLYGPAGTGIVFNIAVLHTATRLPTRSERKSVQIYYGHADRDYLSEDSVIPEALWRDHSDPAARAFYGVLNDKTRTYVERMESKSPASFEATLAMLRELDVRFGRREHA